MINIVNHKGNTNENHNEVSSLVVLASIKKTDNNICKDVEKGELCRCKWSEPLCKTVWRVIKICKIELPHDPIVSLLGRHSKALKSTYRRAISVPYSLQHYSQELRYEIKLSIHSQMNGNVACV